jgi:hypothetical protein
MKIIAIFLVFNFFILIPSLSFGRGGNYEMYCKTSNINATDTVYFSIEATSPIWLFSYADMYKIGTEYNGHSLTESDTLCCW